MGAIFHALAHQKECQIIGGHLMPDHVHRCITLPPKHPVASLIRFLKKKSSIAIADSCAAENAISQASSGRPSGLDFGSSTQLPVKVELPTRAPEVPLRELGSSVR